MNFSFLKNFFRKRKGVESLDKGVVAIRSKNAKQTQDSLRFDINLMPDADRIAWRKKKIRVFIGSISISVGLILFIFSLLTIQKMTVQRNIRSTEGELEIANQTIDRLRPILNESMSLREQVLATDYVMRNHPYWEEFFQTLESLTLPSVTFTNLNADRGGSVTLTGQTDRYEQVSDQFRIFQTSKMISSVEVSGISKVLVGETETGAGEKTEPSESTTSKEMIQFSLTIQFDQSLFLKPKSS